MTRMSDDQRQIDLEFKRLVNSGWPPYLAELQATINVNNKKTKELVKWRRCHG